ncbi:MAG: hypothetical protein K5872_17545 [Rhizobiaceae bacterium]|nr:hypothetical protein [Rhizobiaceae bacterium]MCV0408030.1 hypothetical protein [Rhizobiaceae bacterium]
MSQSFYSTETKEFDQLDEEADERLNALWEKFLELKDLGDIDRAEAAARQAWHALPEPRLSWDYFSNVMPFTFAEWYRDLGRFNMAEQWLALARESYGPGRDASVEFLAATIAYRKGDADAAYAEFDRQYKAFGLAPFKGEDPDYLAFYKARAKASK